MFHFLQGWFVCSSTLVNKLKIMKTRYKMILGICLMPLFVLAYYNDRIIMFLLPHLDQPSIQSWFRNNKFMSNTLIRLIVFWSSIGIYQFISWLIG